MITANYTVPNARSRPPWDGTWRPAAAAPRARPRSRIPLVAPQTMFEPRRTQVDLRLTKFLRLTRAQFQLNFDVYNALNASNVVTLNTNYGPSWLQPTSFLTGRLYEIGMQWSF